MMKIVDDYAFVSLPFILLLVFSLFSLQAFGQPQSFTATEDLVTYTKQSNFIKEFEVPVQELGLKGITTDAVGNVWLYHSTNKTSTIIKFEPDSRKFIQYPVPGDTVANNAIINLASSQLAFDRERNAVWFSDARINSIGKLDISSGKIDLTSIPTEEAGPMGIALSPDGESLWFTEITGNKIGSLDVESMNITEYSTGQDSGPALLTFDDSGLLWISLSFSDSILLVQPWSLIPNSSLGMTRITLPEPDRFSPLGIAVTEGKIFISDHGSSRVIVSDVKSNLQNYTQYWTSPSPVLPTTLPSQVVADGQGNIYFAEHGGNRISEIRQDGTITEYEIPTGPVSTAVYLAASEDGKIWFAEWASNKIAYLDTAIKVPFELQLHSQAITLDRSGSKSLDVSVLELEGGENRYLSLSEVEIGLTGMSDSGLVGITYVAQPPRVNIEENQAADSRIEISARETAKPGNYTVMAKAVAPEKGSGPLVSRLYPITLTLDVPEPSKGESSAGASDNQSAIFSESLLRDTIRWTALSAAFGLIAFLVYRRIKRSKKA